MSDYVTDSAETLAEVLARFATNEALMQRTAELVQQREGVMGLPHVAARYLRALTAALAEKGGDRG